MFIDRYAPSYDGRPYLKECLASFLTSTVFKAPVSKDDVIVVAGSGAVMDIMGTALMNPPMDGKPADAFICITPCYNSFNNNFSLRNGAIMYKADITPTKYCYFIEIMCSYIITEEVLEQAYQAAIRDGRKVRMLVFTNPNNPTGNVFSKEEMMIVLRFCRKYNIHLVIKSLFFLIV